MPMERTNDSPPMASYLIKQNVFGNDPFCLVDVGASGGIDPIWNLFGSSFIAFAFEPLIAECERLNKDIKKHENVTYFPYIVTAEDPVVHAESDPNSDTGFQRTSAAKAIEVLKLNYIQEHFNHGGAVAHSNKEISLDRFFATYPIETIDFIKIDTDGHDYEVIHGARSLLQSKQVLGVTIESQFHGRLNPHANLFRNIDKLLTEQGFSLFDLQVHRYTKKDLPGSFCYDIPAQTTTGQALWGDAVYFRDSARGQTSLSPVKILKLATLFEIFSLADCAAELLIANRDRLSSLIDVQKCLDLLVKNMGSQNTYNEYVKNFETNVSSFFPSSKSKRQPLLVKMLKKLLSTPKYLVL
jgi:FkbM family methyltransferase